MGLSSFLSRAPGAGVSRKILSPLELAAKYWKQEGYETPARCPSIGIAKAVVKIKYISLVNLIMNRLIIKELI